MDTGWKTESESGLPKNNMAKNCRKTDLGCKTWTEAKQVTKDRDLAWKTWTEAKKVAKDRDLGWKTWTEAKQVAKDRGNCRRSTAALCVLGPGEDR